MTLNAGKMQDYANLTELLLAKHSQQEKSIKELKDSIKKDIEKTKNKLFIVSAAYDHIYKKYYAISLSILILSSILTFIEATRLSIIDYINKNNPPIDEQLLSFIMNIVALCVGTVITVLSSIVRFKNYREILEQLREKQNLIIDYRDKYNKKYEQVLHLSSSKNISDDAIKAINDKLTEYENEMKSMNILQYLRNKDIIQYNKFKAHFECELKKIEIEKRLTLQRYETVAKQTPKVSIKKFNFLGLFSTKKRVDKNIQTDVNKDDVI